MRMLRKPERVRREHQSALRQIRRESTSLRTALSGVGVLSVLLEKRRVGVIAGKRRMMMVEYQQDHLGVESVTRDCWS